MKKENEPGAYAELVAKVKKEFADRPLTGDEVQHEIAKRWAAINKRDFDDTAPPATYTPPTSTTAPTAKGFNEPGEGVKVPTPEEGGADDLLAEGS